MKTNSKKALLREKLKSNFEWTTEAIEDFNVNGLSISVVKTPSPVKNRVQPSPDFMVKSEPRKDTMEEKIERVQMRKKEAGDRAVKKSRRLSHSSNLNHALKEYQDSIHNGGENLNTFEVANRLNKYFQDLLAENQIMKVRSESDSIMPLHFFDVSTYDELLVQPSCLYHDDSVSGGKMTDPNQMMDKNEDEIVIRAVCFLSKSQLSELQDSTKAKGDKKILDIDISDYKSENENENENEKIRNDTIGQWFSCEVLHSINDEMIEETAPENDCEKDQDTKEDYDNLLKAMRTKSMKEEESKKEYGMKKYNRPSRRLLVRIITNDISTINNIHIKSLLEQNDESDINQDATDVTEGAPTIFTVNPMQVYFLEQSLEIYGNRITDAILLRRNCTALNKYHFFVRSMPYDNSIASSLGQSQMAKIRAKCMR